MIDKDSFSNAVSTSISTFMKSKPIEFNSRVSAKFHFDVFKESGEQVSSLVAPNLVLNRGLDRLMQYVLTTSSADTLRWIRLGSGTSAVDPTQVNLANQTCASSSSMGATYGNSGAEPYYSWVKYRIRFSVGVATGTHYEVGAGWEGTGNTLFSRALITDVNGNPTSITVLADEYLDVTYEVRVYFPTESDWTGNITTPQGVSHSVTLRRAGIGGANLSGEGVYPGNSNSHSLTWTGFGINGVTLSGNSIGATTSWPNSGGVSQGGRFDVTITPVAYTDGTFYRDVDFTWALDKAVGLVKSISVCAVMGGWQAEFNPRIDKTSATTLTMRMRFSVDRYTP